jgi:site-specific DNA-methyltransferase (adenine-specific)/modification methylase
VSIVRTETIGNATLYLADCAEVVPTLQRFDLLLSDPPYGIGESSKKNASRGVSSPKWKHGHVTDYGAYDWDTAAPSAETIAACVASAPRSILWGGNYFGLPAASKWLVWDKLNTGDFADCELAWTNLPGAVRIFRHMWSGFSRASENKTPRVHPTQKPILLMEWCIAQAGDISTVIDPFMGSGTTGVACANHGKSFVGIEREPKYFDIACERIRTAQSQTRLFA